MSASAQFRFEAPALSSLIVALMRREYEVVGPVARDGAIVYDQVQFADDLPVRWTDEQDGGTCRLKHQADRASWLRGWTAFVEEIPSSAGAAVLGGAEAGGEVAPSVFRTQITMPLIVAGQMAK